jgi:hypothetical protein
LLAAAVLANPVVNVTGGALLALIGRMAPFLATAMIVALLWQTGLNRQSHAPPRLTANIDDDGARSNWHWWHN